MIIREGMVPVREIKKRFPELTVLADTKIADAEAYECGDVVEAGADIMTVLAVCDMATVEEVTNLSFDKLAVYRHTFLRYTNL